MRPPTYLHPLLEAHHPQAERTLQGLLNALAVVAQLRNKTGGCPWDLAQTHESLKRFLLEESHELLEAIDLKQPAHIQEELGDVLLQVLLHTQIASEAGQFTLGEVAQGLAEKLIRRHPHVFNVAPPHGEAITTPEAVTQQWQAIKAQEKGETPSKASVLDGVASSLPLLEQAAKLSRKAVKVGFAWPNDEALHACVQSEFDEFWAEAMAPTPNPDALEDELGDMLFATATLAQHYGISPEAALLRANQKFSRRFKCMEALATQPLETLSFEQWDALWKQAKGHSSTQ